MSFKFGDVQLLDNMKFLGGATSLDSFLKLTKQQKLKASFRMNGSTVHKRGITVNLPFTTHFSANIET